MMLPADIEPSASNLTGLISFSSDSKACAGGGYSDIYRANYQGVEVAVKMLRPGLTADLRSSQRKLLREISVWSGLKHLNVLPFLGYCAAAPSHHLSSHSPDWGFVSPWMQYGEAPNYLSQHPEADRLKVVCGAADGLRYLHEGGIVHGDIKGANILVDDRGVPVLCDFGLATFIEAHTNTFSATLTGSPRGTPRWMAVELLDPHASQNGNSGTSTYQSDTWSFASTIIQLLTLVRPYHSIVNNWQVLGAIIKRQLPYIPPPAASVYPVQPTIVPHLYPLRPDEFEEVDKWDGVWSHCMECWDSDPFSRPSMMETCARLHAIHSRGTIPLEKRASFSRKRSRSPDTDNAKSLYRNSFPSSPPHHASLLRPRYASRSASPEASCPPHEDFEPPYKIPRTPRSHMLSIQDPQPHNTPTDSGSPSRPTLPLSTPRSKQRPSRLSSSFSREDVHVLMGASSPVLDSPRIHPYSRPSIANRRLASASSSSSNSPSPGTEKFVTSSAPASLGPSRSVSHTQSPFSRSPIIATIELAGGSMYASPSSTSVSTDDMRYQASDFSPASATSIRSEGRLLPPNSNPAPAQSLDSVLQDEFRESGYRVGHFSLESLERTPSLSSNSTSSYASEPEYATPSIPQLPLAPGDEAYDAYAFSHYFPSHPMAPAVEDELNIDEWITSSKQNSPSQSNSKQSSQITKDDHRMIRERQTLNAFTIKDEHLQRFPGGIEQFLESHMTTGSDGNEPSADLVTPADILERKLQSSSPTLPVDHWTNSPAALDVRRPLPPDTPSLAPRLTLLETPLPTTTSENGHATRGLIGGDEDWIPDPSSPIDPVPDSYNMTSYDCFEDETDVEEGDEAFDTRLIYPLGSETNDEMGGGGLFGGGNPLGGDDPSSDTEASTPKQTTQPLPTPPLGLGLQLS